MSFTIRYDAEQRLDLSAVSCASADGCDCAHTVPTQDVYVGKDLLRRLPGYIRRKHLGNSCLLVADRTTWEVAGKAVESILRAEGFAVDLCLIRRDGDMEPDESACGEVLLSIRPDTRFLVSVGSGSITDTVRINAVRTGLPFVCVGTAPSMDGYTSMVAPLVLRNAKIHRPAVCPEIIVCDLDILKTAPAAMIAAGVGDVLGKYIAVADWKISNIVNGEPYCPTCGDLVTGAVDRVLENLEAIAGGTEEGVRTLVEALLLAGITVLVIGNTRAVASVEHNIAHTWDMMCLRAGEKPPSHGAAVGVATLLCLPLYSRFARENPDALAPGGLRSGPPDREERARQILETYGEEAGNTIMRENPEDFLTLEERERRVGVARARFGEIRRILDGLPEYDRIAQAMLRLGAATTPAALGIDRRRLGLSMRNAKDYRSRYTLLKLVDECGLPGDYLADYPVP